jgi:hypothetical protein
MEGTNYPAAVLDALLDELREMSTTNEFYPVHMQRAWWTDRYVCVVYRYHGRDEQYGLCLDVLDPERRVDEPDAGVTAARIRVGDLEEVPPTGGHAIGSDGTHWWGDIGDAVPRSTWDRPPPSGPAKTVARRPED